MEFFLFALFFIFTLVFFIAGKDDFGRTEKKLVIKEEKEEKEVSIESTGDVKQEAEIKTN